MDVKKKARERYCLEQFRHLYPGFPGGPVEDSERPDFLVCGPDGTVGIEIVEYVRGQGGPDGSQEIRREAMGEMMAVEARRTWASRGGCSVHVWFSFGLGVCPDKASVPKLASLLADVVLFHTPYASQVEAVLGHEQMKDTAIENVVDHVRIRRWPDSAGSHWMYLPGASFINVGQAEIQRLIDGKNAKVDAYSRRCHRVWLLISARGGRSLARMGIPSPDIHGHTFRSRFDKVCFIDLERETVLDLRQRE